MQKRYQFDEFGVEEKFVAECLDEMETLGMYQRRDFIERPPRTDLDYDLELYDPLFTGVP